jgi:ribosomal protein S14
MERGIRIPPSLSAFAEQCRELAKFAESCGLTAEDAKRAFLTAAEKGGAREAIFEWARTTLREGAPSGSAPGVH